MKRTLLDMTQDILAAIESDEVNSINDSVEADQVARIIRTVYYDLVIGTDLAEHDTLFELLSSVDPTKPTLMYRPENITRISWIKYDKQTKENPVANFETVHYLPLTEFLERMYSIPVDNSTVFMYNMSTSNGDIEIPYRNDKSPDFYSIVDDSKFLFDSYDSEVDTTLQKNKTLVYGSILPEFNLVDNFIPNLDAQQFPLLYQEAKSLAFAEILKIRHEKSEKSARNHKITLQRRKDVRNPNYQNYPNYGRK